MGTRIRIEFVDEGVSAIAELDEEAAPRSCAAVLDALPQEGEAHHATYSGSEVAFVLDQDLGIGIENATSKVIPGDLGYTRFEGGLLYGIPTSFSELAWFYDRDATPNMADGPVPMNIIGTIVEGFDELTAVCRSMRRTGVKNVRISVEE